jgi:uncharacterized protein (TIGR00369 family)
MTPELDALQGFFASAPFMVQLGVQVTAVTEGRLSTQMLIEQRHLQHTGQVHAGVMASLADHSMGAAAQTMAPEDHWIVTAELKTSVLRPARGERLLCEAVVLKSGRRLSFTEAEVFAQAPDGQRTLVMKASATMALALKQGS